MAALAPRPSVVVLPGERHMIGLTAPGAVNRALADWLAAPLAPEREQVR